MRAQLIKSSPGAGKTTAVAAAIRDFNASARIVTGSLRLARELATEQGYALVEGRHPGNCQRHEVVELLGLGGHKVDALACGKPEKPRCPFRNACPYWRQFEQPGARIGASEQLFNPNFLAGGRLMVIDDADLVRALVERIFISREELGKAYKLLKGKRRAKVRTLLTILSHAVLDSPCRADGSPIQVIGAAGWDQFVRTSRLYGHDFCELVAGLPKRMTLPPPEPGPDGVLDRESVEEAPSANLAVLFGALKRELPMFSSGEDFNSQLRLSIEGIEVWYLRDHVQARNGLALLPDMELLILDATPVRALVDYLTRDHQRLPDVDIQIRTPENVRVIQYATTTNGHAVLRDQTKVDQLKNEIAFERGRVVLPADMEGAICFKRMRSTLVSIGIPEDQVVTFGSIRGTNVLAEVERLHLVGRPMPPSEDLIYLAQVIHAGKQVIDRRMVLVPRAFGGQDYVVDVVDFADPRVAELLRAVREDEMEQAIHRARIYTLEQPTLLEKGPLRRQLQVVLYTSHPIPGLRVDDLITKSEAVQVNDARHDDADQRIRKAILELEERCEPITAVSVARRARASRRTVSNYLRTSDHTPKEESNYKGVITFPQTRSTSPSETGGASSTPPEGLCRGGCGKPMPAGHKCFECARRAVEEWISVDGKARKP